MASRTTVFHTSGPDAVPRMQAIVAPVGVYRDCTDQDIPAGLHNLEWYARFDEHDSKRHQPGSGAPQGHILPEISLQKAIEVNEWHHIHDRHYQIITLISYVCTISCIYIDNSNNTVASLNSSAKASNLRRSVVRPPQVWLALEGVGFSIHGLTAQIAFALHSSTNSALAFAHSTFS